MRLLQIRARADADGDCLMGELAAYSPTRSRSGIQIELEERSEADVLGVLAAVETCLSANEIRSVRVELDGRARLHAGTRRLGAALPKLPVCTAPGSSHPPHWNGALRTQRGALGVVERWNVIRSLRAREAAERFA
jgi:hypothetical protein